jgi:tRNA C32,U32 (ribose-2'-O)-methylase TrmJ
VKELTYRRIIREKISTRENMEKLREEREFFIKHQKLFAEMRMAYGRGRITRQELLTLRGQIKAGDAVGAKKGLMRLLERDCVI